MGKNFCTECGHTLSLNTNFCSGCGNKIHPEEPQLLETAKNICINCGIQHSPSAVFCVSCGKKITREEFNYKNINIEEPETTEEHTPTDDIHPLIYNISSKETDKNLITNDDENEKFILEKTVSPISETSTDIISDFKSDKVEPSDIYANVNTKSEPLILPETQPIANGKNNRRSIKRTFIITLTILVVFLGVLTAYLNGWHKNPFNKQIPYDPEASVYSADMGDWQNSPDLKKEQDAIAKRQRELISSLEKDNIKKAVKYFYPEYQPTWQKQMEDDPEGTATLAAVLSTAEMTFLGKPNELKDDPRSRTATFVVEFEQSGFYITWIKYDGTWYLYDF